MKLVHTISGIAAFLFCSYAFAAGLAPPRSLTVTMSNDPGDNSVFVFDTDSRALLQTLPTHGKGGVGGNQGGVRALDQTMVAVVNYGSGTVSIFERVGDRLA